MERSAVGGSADVDDARGKGMGEVEGNEGWEEREVCVSGVEGEEGGDYGGE